MPTLRSRQFSYLCRGRPVHKDHWDIVSRPRRCRSLRPFLSGAYRTVYGEPRTTCTVAKGVLIIGAVATGLSSCCDALVVVFGQGSRSNAFAQRPATDQAATRPPWLQDADWVRCSSQGIRADNCPARRYRPSHRIVLAGVDPRELSLLQQGRRDRLAHPQGAAGLPPRLNVPLLTVVCVQPDSKWWFGQVCSQDGVLRKGWIPSNYVAELR